MSANSPLRQPQIMQHRPTRSFASFRATTALMLREMATKYGRSPGGYVWALLEPMGSILVLAIAFSLLLRSPPLGNSFIMFYATGFLPFTLYMNVSKSIASSISFSRPLLKYPAVNWVDAVQARFILNTLTSILVALLLLSGLIVTIDTGVQIDIVMVLLATGFTLLLAAGIGTLNCVLFGLFPVWSQIWGMATRPLMIASGIIFLVDDLPPVAQNILWYNPLVHVVSLMHAGFYPNYRPDHISLIFIGCVGFITLFFGILLLGRYHRELLNNG